MKLNRYLTDLVYERLMGRRIDSVQMIGYDRDLCICIEDKEGKKLKLRVTEIEEVLE